MCVCVCVCVCALSHVPLFAQLWTIAHRVPLSMGFSRQEYWSELPFPPPGDLPDPGIKPMSPASPALAGGFFTAEWPGSSDTLYIWLIHFAVQQKVTQHCKATCCSVAKSRPPLYNPRDCSTLGFPVLHDLPEFAQTHVHHGWWCHPTTSSSVITFSPCPLSFPASGSFQWVSSLHQVTKALELQF